MMGYCGTYCETCEWKDKMACKGCKQHASQVFWGSCKIAACAIAKDLEHCGQCSSLPCDKLVDAHNTEGHSDKGERMDNLKNWAKGIESTLKVTLKE